MVNEYDFDALASEVLHNCEARAGYAENAIRRQLASSFDAARKEQEVSVRLFAERLGTSLSQVQRLLHHKLGGSLTLHTICKAADVLGFHVVVQLVPAQRCAASDGDEARWNSWPCTGGAFEAKTIRVLRAGPREFSKQEAWSVGGSRDRRVSA